MIAALRQYLHSAVDRRNWPDDEVGPKIRPRISGASLHLYPSADQNARSLPHPPGLARLHRRLHRDDGAGCGVGVRANGSCVGDVAFRCACGKAKLLTRCYSKFSNILSHLYNVLLPLLDFPCPHYSAELNGNESEIQFGLQIHRNSFLCYIHQV
jgi:hypothetical protein